MPAPYSFLNFALEDAVKAYILATDNPEPAKVYLSADLTGEDESIAEPYLCVICETARPPDNMDIGLESMVGNQSLELTVYIRTHAANEDVKSIGQNISARQYHAELCGRVLDMFRRSDLSQALTDMQIPNIGFNEISLPTVKTAVADRAYVTSVSMTIHAYPKADQ